MDLGKYGQSIENLFLELHGYLARFEKVGAEIEKLHGKADQLDGDIKSEDLCYQRKCALAKDAYQALSRANFEAVTLVESLGNVVSGLEDAQEPISELTQLIVAERDWKANERKARKSAFYKL